MTKFDQSKLRIVTLPFTQLTAIYYVDLALPFGLGSAPSILNAVAEAVEWLLVNSYKVPDLLQAIWMILLLLTLLTLLNVHRTSLAVCRRLGLPLRPGKCVGGTPLLIVHLLGIDLDSLAQVARLPAEKLQVPRDLIR